MPILRLALASREDLVLLRRSRRHRLKETKHSKIPTSLRSSE